VWSDLPKNPQLSSDDFFWGANFCIFKPEKYNFNTYKRFFLVNKLALICHFSNFKNCQNSPTINDSLKKKFFHIWSTAKFG